MRKWIVQMLFGGDAKTFDDMFSIAIECHQSCKKLLKMNESLLERYKAISEENLALLYAIRDAKDIPELMLQVIDIVTNTRERMLELKEE